MDEVVRQLAQREWEAQQGRQRAETAWRSAWWETTLALATMGHATEGYDAAMAELGQSRAYLQQRRRVGLAVVTNAVTEVNKLAPSFAVEWVREGRSQIDKSAIAAILKAEEDHVSVRAFIADVARPQVRRTPVVVRQTTFEDQQVPQLLTPLATDERPEPEPVSLTAPPSWSTPVSQSNGHADGNGHGDGQWPPAPPAQRYRDLSAATVEVDHMNLALHRLSEVLPKLDPEVQPTVRGLLLEHASRVADAVASMEPEAHQFDEREAHRLLG